MMLWFAFILGLGSGVIVSILVSMYRKEQCSREAAVDTFVKASALARVGGKKLYLHRFLCQASNGRVAVKDLVWKDSTPDL